MENKIIVVDFSGTLIKSFVVEDANLLRFKILGLKVPSKVEHKKMHATKSHYEIIKKEIEKQCGIKDNMNILYDENKGKQIWLNGKEIKTTILTDLFKYTMYVVANKYKSKIFDTKFLSSLKKIQKKGYKLALVSGVRSDIISGVLQIAKCSVKFDYILGQDSILSKQNNEEQLFRSKKKGSIKYVIGDKSDDLKYAKKMGAKSILVTWGHLRGDENKYSDYVIKNGNELLKVIK